LFLINGEESYGFSLFESFIAPWALELCVLAYISSVTAGWQHNWRGSVL